ncbi:MAG: hypothetical protein ABI845_04465 [Polaromonas sp.]
MTSSRQPATVQLSEAAQALGGLLLKLKKPDEVHRAFLQGFLSSFSHGPIVNP